jgi:hypothetical protein
LQRYIIHFYEKAEFNKSLSFLLILSFTCNSHAYGNDIFRNKTFRNLPENRRFSYLTERTWMAGILISKREGVIMILLKYYGTKPDDQNIGRRIWMHNNK